MTALRVRFYDPDNNDIPNVRATRLVMACGMFSHRFYGTVVLFRTNNASLTVANVQTACAITPDLRSMIINELGVEGDGQRCSSSGWLSNACRDNNRDEDVLSRYVQVMTTKAKRDDVNAASDLSGSSSSTSDDGMDVLPKKNDGSLLQHDDATARTVPLCLQCRRPASDLSQACLGACFCIETCRSKG